jgi:hypothetical protein
MNAEDTVRYLYEVYSYRRGGALDHLFFVIGNGYEWQRGELVSGDLRAELIPQYAEEHRREVTDDMRRMWEAFDARMGDKLGCIVKPMEERIKEYWRDKLIARDLPVESDYRIYPLCKYSRIMNVPDDVTDDWLALAMEAIDWALGLDATEHNATQHEILRGVRDTLIARFGRRAQ